MPTPAWSHFPLAAAEPQGRSWLVLLGNLGRSPATVDAYGRGLDRYLRFCRDRGIDASGATLEHVSLFVRHLNGEAEGAAAGRVGRTSEPDGGGATTGEGPLRMGSRLGEGPIIRRAGVCGASGS